MIKNYDFFVFDFDDTLIETGDLHRHAYELALQNTNLNTAFNYGELAGIDTNTAFQSLGFNDQESQELTILKRSYYDQLTKESLPQWVPGMQEVLDALDAINLSYAIVSSGSRIRILHILMELNSLDRFDFIVSRDDVETSKPNPEPYLSALSRMRVSADKALVIEDSLNGYTSASTAGFAVWQLTRTEMDDIFSPISGDSNELKEMILGK